MADQPWTPGRRRQLALRFLQAKLEAPSEALQLEGATGMWELAIMKEHHADMASREALGALVTRMGSPNIEVGTRGACWRGYGALGLRGMLVGSGCLRTKAAGA